MENVLDDKRKPSAQVKGHQARSRAAFKVSTDILKRKRKRKSIRKTMSFLYFVLFLLFFVSCLRAFTMNDWQIDWLPVPSLCIASRATGPNPGTAGSLTLFLRVFFLPLTSAPVASRVGWSSFPFLLRFAFSFPHLHFTFNQLLLKETQKKQRKRREGLERKWRLPSMWMKKRGEKKRTKKKKKY